MPDEKKNERLLLTAVFLFWFSNYTYPSFLTTYATNTLGATKVLAGMKDYDILDLLDADTLGLYCSKLARWEEIERAYSELRERYREDGYQGKDLKLLAALSSELQSLEAGILTYATKLGLTPDGRARLARRLFCLSTNSRSFLSSETVVVDTNESLAVCFSRFAIQISFSALRLHMSRSF